MPSPSLALSSNAKTASTNLKAEDQVMSSYKAISSAIQSHGFGCCPRPCLGGGNEDTPGPGAYRLKSTLIGHVADSRFRSNTGFTLRSRTTFGSDITSSIRSTVATPGPGAYVCVQQPSGGLMVNPKERNVPRFSFPKGHFPRVQTRLQPGPGQYQLKEAMCLQTLSSKINPPSFTFGRSRSRPSSSSSIYSTRSTCSFRHTDMMDIGDVGPGSYDYDFAFGKQVDSRKQNCGGTRFGTSGGPSPPKWPSLSRGKRGETSTIMKP